VRNTVGPIAVIVQLGATILVATLLPLLVGLWLDGIFHTTPWITLVALVVGVILAIATVYNVISTQYKKLS
jgi:F0F1-type ATP synthase assembly protein I